MERSIRPPFSERLTDFWFNRGSPNFGMPVRASLRLLELIYRLGLGIRQIWTRISPPKKAAGIRVIAVGNLVVGGAGKTPCTLALSVALKARSIPFGIIARGYRSKAETQPARLIRPRDLQSVTPGEIGDEPWLLCWRTQQPVVVGADRSAAIALLQHTFPGIEVALLDDGLQQRSIAFTDSLVLIDQRALGNQRCLPAGPLREPIDQLRRFDHWVDNVAPPDIARRLPLPTSRGTLTQTNDCWVPLAQWRDPAMWKDFAQGLHHAKGQSILAIAGIATPEQFFDTLRDHGLTIDTLALPDHASDLVTQTLRKWEEKHYDLVLMTEKDAVKFFHEPTPIHNRAWALRRDAALDPDFLKRLLDGPKTS